jgi:hypothetical protein
VIAEEGEAVAARVALLERADAAVDLDQRVHHRGRSALVAEHVDGHQVDQQLGLAAAARLDQREQGVQRAGQRAHGILVRAHHPGVAVAHEVELAVAGQGLGDAFAKRVLDPAAQAVEHDLVAARVVVAELVALHGLRAQRARPDVVRGAGEGRDQIGGLVAGEGAARAGAVESGAREAVDAQVDLDLGGRALVAAGHGVQELPVRAVAAGKHDREDK